MWAQFSECRRFYIKSYSSTQPFCPPQPAAEKMQTEAGLLPGFFQGSQDLTLAAAWLQLLLSTQREGNLGLLDGCPFKHQAAPLHLGNFTGSGKATHTQKAQSLQVHLFPSRFSSFPHQRIKFLYFQQNWGHFRITMHTSLLICTNGVFRHCPKTMSPSLFSLLPFKISPLLCGP